MPEATIESLAVAVFIHNPWVPFTTALSLHKQSTAWSS